MKTYDLLQQTYASLSGNKVRSGLTMLGIIIGIASVIAMTAIGQGAQNQIQASIQSIGSNLIIVMPGVERGPGFQAYGARGGAQSLTIDDANAILSQVPDVKAIAPEVSGRYQITAPGTNSNTSVNGVTASYADVRNVSISQGNFISDSDVNSVSRVAVLGPATVTDLFGDSASPIGQNIRIKGQIFRIIGVTESQGGSGFSNADDVIYIPISTAQLLLSGNKYVNDINVSAASAEVTTSVQNGITSLLLERHGISNAANADFSTLNQTDIIAAASSVTGTFTALLAAVAGISLLVGGIGIMNMMLTTVTERTREIGLRKSIGAKKKDINKQFLTEAVMLTFLGGVTGVALGWLGSVAITKLGVLEASVSLDSVLLAFGVSAAIGIIFGYYPAKKAADMSPIDALRYE